MPKRSEIEFKNAIWASVRSIHRKPELLDAAKADGRMRLWAAVIVEALFDYAVPPMRTTASTHLRVVRDAKERERNRREALRWLEYPSADFRFVCDHAGLEPDDVLRLRTELKNRKTLEVQ